MAFLNDNYLKLKAGYLFPEIGRRVRAYQAAHPDAQVIRLGIGDVTEPLPPVCLAALHAATDEMAHRATFKGYGPEQGYAFLREAATNRLKSSWGYASLVDKYNKNSPIKDQALKVNASEGGREPVRTSSDGT